MKWIEKFKTIAEFAGHIFAATVVFCVIGLAALLLHIMTAFLKSHGLDGFVIILLEGLEMLVFICDALVYAAWVIMSSIKAFKAI